MGGVIAGIPTRHGWAAVVASVLLVAVSACDGGGNETVDVGEEGDIVALAAPAAAALRQGLVTRLTAALEEGGPAGAVEFCSSEAIPLTSAIQAGMEGGLTLKRTSFRYRNSANAPDEAEEAALLRFERSLQGPEGPLSHLTQRVSETEYRYYEPLYVGEPCLQCHGVPERLAPGVGVILEERYPGDLATGYAAGDFRGLIRVSVPSTALIR
jgi:hypothetical protein